MIHFFEGIFISNKEIVYKAFEYNQETGGMNMPVYTITAFDKDGSKLLDENFEALTDAEAKQKGEALLTEKGFDEKTHRLVSPAGKLILFHR